MKDMTTGNFLNLAGPPRSVPILVRSKILFGSFSSQFGCFFFGFGMMRRLSLEPGRHGAPPDRLA